VQASGKTALHDAVIAALDHVETSNLQKHAIVVLSDGEDNASHRTAEEMFDRVLASDAIVYTVATGDPMTGEGGKPGVLRKLARIGGGGAYFPRRHQEVVNYFAEIAENIRLGYTIGYIPANTARDGGFRRVKVMVRANGRSRLSVQCRDGYRAPGPTSSR
jgi:Ca-activated chloride channel homolog